MLTALDDDSSQVKAFNHYADDYVIKPVSPIILLKRIETVLRRMQSSIAKREQESADRNEGNLSSEKKLILEPEAYTASYGGKNLSLTLSEFLLLQALYESPNRVFTREMLIL